MHGANCKQCVVMHEVLFIFKYHLWQTDTDTDRCRRT